jgi:phosphate starvation-inducible membrane PsiE
LNGLKRSFTSPVRLIYLLFFFGYYAFLINRFALVFAGPSVIHVPKPLMAKLAFPPLDVVDAIAFAFFTAGWLIMLVALTSNQNPMRPADVDVLFPTPVSPKVVLGFRIVRDYFFTLLTPLFIALLGMRASRMGWEALFRGMPHAEYSGLALRAITMSWTLMALCFVAIVHAVHLYVNRSDRNGDRYNLLLNIVISVYFFGFIGFLVYWFQHHPGVQSGIQLANSPFMRAIMFLPTFACDLTMAPFRADLKSAMLGISGLVAVIILGLRVAFSQIAWFYDECAVKGSSTDTTRSLQRKGDIAGIMAQRARAGKYRVRRAPFVTRLQFKGSWALIWKELIVQPRTLRFFISLMFLIEVALSGASAYAANGTSARNMPGIMLIFVQGSFTFMISTVVGQTGFNEVLRRVDIEKAFPFSSFEVVLKEVLARSLIGAFTCWVGAIVFAVINPSGWRYALASCISTPAGCLVLLSAMFLVTVLFPDMDDTTQRQFRGLVTIFSFAASGFVPLVVFIVLAIVKVPVVICSIGSALASVLIAWLLIKIAANIYGSFNASE